MKRLVRLYLPIIFLILPCFLSADQADKKLADNYYTPEVASSLQLYGKMMMLERAANAMAKGCGAEASAQNDALIDECEQLAKELKLETDVDWHLLRHYLGTRHTCTGCGYLNNIVQIQAQAVAMVALIGQINTALAGPFADCVSKCTELVYAIDQGGGEPFIGTVGLDIDGITWPAGVYCLAEYVSYNNGTGTPAVTISSGAPNTTFDFLDNTINGAGSTNGLLVWVTADDVVIKNGSIIGGGSDTGCLLLGLSLSNITVQDMVISGSAAGYGLLSIRNNNVVVKNVIADENLTFGIKLLGQSDNVVVQNCIARENGQEGFFVDNTGELINGLVMEDNIAINNTEPGYRFTESVNPMNALVKSNIAIANATSAPTNDGGYFISTGTPPDTGSIQLVNNIARDNGTSPVTTNYVNYSNGTGGTPDYTPADWIGSTISSEPYGRNISA